MNDPYVEYLNELYGKALQKIAQLQYICTQQAEEIRQLQITPINPQEKTDEKKIVPTIATAAEYFRPRR